MSFQILTPKDIQDIINDKVRGKIIAAHTEQGHFYKFADTGKTVRSVTTKLILEKPHLIPWAVEKGVNWLEEDESRWAKLKGPERLEYLTAAKLAHTEVRDDAGSVGSQGHDVIERWVNDWIEKGAPNSDIKSFIAKDANYRVYGVARSAEAVFKKYNVVPIASELLVGIEDYNSAGTLDMLVYNLDTSEIELWDWKSSNAINQEGYPMQVATYMKFFELMTGLKIGKIRVIKLDKFSDRFKVYNLLDPDTAFQSAVAISHVYDWVHNGQVKLKEDKKTLQL